MCGITGAAWTAGAEPLAIGILERMTTALAHRGPDATGIHVGGPVAFGHLHLAIIDLSGGHQPRIDPLTGDALIYNGEIYGFGVLAAELVALRVDVIVASVDSAVEAAKRATSTIPIVMTAVTFPTELGLIASLARPEGNVTGLSFYAGGTELRGQRLERPSDSGRFLAGQRSDLLTDPFRQEQAP